MEVALTSAMVLCPKAETSFFWGLAPLTDSLSKPSFPCYLPIGREGFTEEFTPSQVQKEGSWVC